VLAEREDAFEMAAVGVLDAHRGAEALGFTLKQATEIADAMVSHGRTQ